MLRRAAGIVPVLMLVSSCAVNDAPKPTGKAETSAAAFPLKITQFYSDPTVIRGAGKTTLCYGVEGATKVTLDPPEERLWPAMVRCFDVSPKATTTYTLTAENDKGEKVTQKTMVQVGPPSVKIVEVSVNTLTVKPGEAFPFCVHAINASSWKLSGGSWRNPPDSRGGCAVDYPKQTTTYVITAIGAMGETDSERVTATVQQ